jgi:CheY-like chemotaxis protein
MISHPCKVVLEELHAHFLTRLQPFMNILIVDNNEIMAKLMQELLTLQGHTAERVRTPQEALSAVTRGPFDVALIDLDMHNTHGIEIARGIRSNAAQIKLVAISASDVDEKVFDHYLPKPVDFVELHRIVSP